MKRVFQNLIGNALIHGEGDIFISLSKQGEKKEICFCNTTNTIEHQDINKLFERFYTTDKSRTKKTTGLGLSIAKQFVIQMHGTIQAELNQNKFQIKIEF